MKTTKQIITEMLTENTGAHFLDSGGETGRNWQRNQTREFENEPRVTVDYFNGKLDTFTVSIFHYLNEVLEVDDFCHIVNNKFETDQNLFWVRDFESEELDLVVSLHNTLQGEECGYIYSARFQSEMFNTYNHENNIDQIFLGRLLNINGEAYALIQIHGGADVRGGYTLTKCFKLTGYLTGNVDVYGTANGLEISNTYNGWSLTDDEGNEVEISENEPLELDFCTIDNEDVYDFKNV